jgi:hypothetical protein
MRTFPNLLVRLFVGISVFVSLVQIHCCAIVYDLFAIEVYWYMLNSVRHGSEWLMFHSWLFCTVHHIIIGSEVVVLVWPIKASYLDRCVVQHFVMGVPRHLISSRFCRGDSSSQFLRQ